MDWVWSTSGRAVVRKRLTACARHSSKDLAALQKVVLGLVDLCTGCQSVCAHSSYACPGVVAVILGQTWGSVGEQARRERSVPRPAAPDLATKIDLT